MNSEDLRVFRAVLRAASIKGAARALKVDHSTVSRRVAALEESLGVRLFERTPEGLVPTEAAEAIAPFADQMDHLMAELTDAARAASDTPRGPVRLAVSPVVAEYFLMPRVAELERRFPDIELDVRAQISRASLAGEREADLAIRQHPEGRPPGESSALAVKVGRVGFALFASREYVERRGKPGRPVTTLAGHSVIGTTPWGPGESWFAELESPGTRSLSAYPYSTAYAAVLHGRGLSLLPCLGADTDSRLVRVSDVVARFDMWVVTSNAARNNARVRALKDALVEMVREARGEISGESS